MKNKQQKGFKRARKVLKRKRRKKVLAKSTNSKKNSNN